ncbi:MAG: WYL domain-containing protein [Vallitalea sp.]|jgi:hypothetical protein|nr:WYL domain-containing protein [Vallitalea sp.]
MNLFSEVYGKYYQLISQILNEAQNKSISIEYIYEIIREQGFEDTLITLAPRIINNDKDSYNLLNRNSKGYQSILSKEPSVLLTTLELRWIKTLLMDKRIQLFLNEEELMLLKEQLIDVKELFDEDTIVYIGQANDGDPYDDINYIKYFRQLLYAVNNKKCLNITYYNSEGIRRCATYAGYRIEYSVKDDKFRLNAVLIKRGKIIYHSKINVARIINAQIIESANYPSDISEYIYAHKMPEPIEVIVNNERNGFERVFVHLSNYERNAEYHEETNTCKVKIYYYDFDETELLIQLLSYGPILKVVGPEEFKKKVVDRIDRQKKLWRTYCSS